MHRLDLHRLIMVICSLACFASSTSLFVYIDSFCVIVLTTIWERVDWLTYGNLLTDSPFFA